MGSKVVYSCDHCKIDVKREQLTSIYLSIALEDEGSMRRPTFSKEVCDDCLSEFELTEDRSSRAYISNYNKADRRFYDIIKKFFTRRD